MNNITLDPDQKENKTLVDDELLLEHNQNLSYNDTQDTNTEQKDSLMKSPKLMIFLTVVAVLAGVGTGFGTFRITNKPSSDVQVTEVPTTSTTVSAGDEFGSKDEAFDSHAIGYIEEGGIDGEGSHKLLRPGGDSQTVYLTSSVTDLDVFVGMEVELWGETFKGQKAGWFMDVGRVKVVNTQAEAPIEE
jgi:hypothetical protein